MLCTQLKCEKICSPSGNVTLVWGCLTWSEQSVCVCVCVCACVKMHVCDFVMNTCWWVAADEACPTVEKQLRCEWFDNGTKWQTKGRVLEWWAGCVVLYVCVCNGVQLWGFLYSTCIQGCVCVFIQEERTLRCYSHACLYFGFCERPSVPPAVSTLTDYTLTGPTLTAS